MSPMQRLVRVVSDVRSRRRCSFCRKSIEWATTEQARSLPLEPGAFVLRVERGGTEGRVRFDVLSPTSIHRCAKRPSTMPRRPQRRSVF